MSLQLHMFHGRRTPTESMDDWGSDGPTVGGIVAIHTTYKHHIRASFADPKTMEIVQLVTGWRTFDENILEIDIVEDMIMAGGKYYGDWTISEEPNGTR